MADAASRVGLEERRPRQNQVPDDAASVTAETTPAARVKRK
jgi:hypothetical protein